jgi:hypothetical protein
MNCKNLVKLMAAVTATVALCGCAIAPAQLHTADIRQEAAGEPGHARNAWEECVRAAIPGLDDVQSSSEAVARAAMKGCSDEYSDMLRAVSRTSAQTCGQDSDCTRGALAKTQREATQAAIDDVVTARVRVAGAQVLKCE